MASQYFVRAGGGPEAGPMSGSAVRDLVRSGELGADDLIRTDSSVRWMKVGSVPQLASELPKPPPPPADELGLHEAVAATAAAAPAAREPSRDQDAPPRLKKVDVTTFMVLSAVTLGIYGYIWFWGVMKSYRAISGRKEPNLEPLYWAFLGCSVLGALLALWVIGFVILIGAAAVSWIILDNVLKDRAKVASAVGGVKGLADRPLLLGFWIAGQVLWICGFPFALYQAYRFAEDHNRIVKACESTHPEWVASSASGDE